MIAGRAISIKFYLEAESLLFPSPELAVLG